MFEDVGVIDLACVGAATRGHPGELDMADDVQIGIDPAGQIAFKNLDVVAVKHQFQVRCADGLDDPAGLVGVIEKISRCGRASPQHQRHTANFR